jgi:hypothetical protein
VVWWFDGPLKRISLERAVTVSVQPRRKTIEKVAYERILRIARVLLRLALGATFLASIADRLGWLGPYGSRNVAWGDWTHFLHEVALLNWFLPRRVIPGLAVLETAIEAGVGVALIVGIYQRAVA